MSFKQRVRKCPICASSDNEVLHTQVFKEYFSHDISTCNNCGFVYVSNTPPESFYHKYYSVESKYEGVRKHEDHDEITKKELIKFVNKYIGKNANILDVGCSTGSLLAFLKSKGYGHVSGIDPAPKCKTFAKKQYGIKVDTYDINSFKPHKKYDLIIISQVLEHIIDVKKNIERIRSWLKDDGYVFIGVPDSERFHLDFEEPFGEFSTEHINFFTESSLGVLMQNFKKIRITQINNVIFSIWMKSNIGKNSILKYIKYSNLKQSKVKKIIESLPNQTIVWGVGALTRRLLSTTNLKNKVLFFIDSSPTLIGKALDGIIIRSPDVLKEYNAPILISSFKFCDEIIQYIKKHNHKNRIIKFK